MKSFNMGEKYMRILKILALICIMSVIFSFGVGCTSSAPNSQPGYTSQPLYTSQSPPVVSYSVYISVNGQGITNPSTGTYTYHQGDSVTITAIPSGGWMFDKWSGGASGTDTTTTEMVNGNMSIIANFKRQPQSFGPQSFNIGIGLGDFTIPSINSGDKVEFQFSAAGSTVYFSVLDPNSNTIITGSGGNKVASGSGSFIASSSGTYTIHFKSSGILTPSVITVNYTQYFAP
jgi:hypothetical protein